MSEIVYYGIVSLGPNGQYVLITANTELIGISSVFSKVNLNNPSYYEVSVALPDGGGVDRKITFQRRSNDDYEVYQDTYMLRSKKPLRSRLLSVCSYLFAKGKKGKYVQLKINPEVGTVTFILGDGSKFLDNNVLCAAA